MSPTVSRLASSSSTRSRLWTRFVPALLLMLAAATRPASAAPPAWSPLDDRLTSFDLHLLGVRARPEPETQIVPRNTPTGVNVVLDFGGSAADPNQMLALLPSGLEIVAELVGPGIAAPIELRGPPGELLPIPPLVTRGMYLVRDIRLEVSGQVLVRAFPDSATVEVIERVLVTQVTTRPLDIEETMLSVGDLPNGEAEEEEVKDLAIPGLLVIPGETVPMIGFGTSGPLTRPAILMAQTSQRVNRPGFPGGPIR